MARTKHLVRISPDLLRPRGARYSLRPFEKEILKYYPKKFRIFQNSQLSQDDKFLEDHDDRDRPLVDLAEDYSPHRRILRKYRADFFQSFKAFYEFEGPRPTKIPRNIRYLVIAEGSDVFLKKLIKQNKELKHLTLHAHHWSACDVIAKFLKYSKSLQSIKLERALPFFSEKMCRQLQRNWSNSIERVEILDEALNNRKSFTRVINTILQFPKLKEFRFLSEAGGDLNHFPLAKLQERNIAYDVRCRIDQESSQSLMKSQSELKPVDRLIISQRDYKYNKNNRMMTKDWKVQNLSQKVLRLDQFPSSSLGLHLLPLIEKISYLNMKLSQEKSDYSNLGYLNNLKNFSLNISNARYLKDFLCYFHESAAQNIKLETVSLKGKLKKNLDKENTSALIHFFESCSKTLRKVNFEFKYEQTLNDDSLGYFDESLDKLKHLQSLSLILLFNGSELVKRFERLGEIISRMKSLEELNFKIKNAYFDKEKLSLTFPSQLKKLSLGVISYRAPFYLTKTLSSLANLTDLELEFANFSSQKFSKMLLDLNKFKGLERLVLKEVEAFSSEYGILRMKPILDDLMKGCLSLKLIIFVNIRSRETAILRRINCPWSEIETICQGLSSHKHLKMIHIKSYED